MQARAAPATARQQDASERLENAMMSDGGGETEGGGHGHRSRSHRRHAAQTAGGLLADNPGRMQAKYMIAEEVERLRWRIWNGKAKNARGTIDRVRKVMHVYKDERGQHTRRSAPSHRLWQALLDVDCYLRGQSSWLVNYAKRYRAGLRVGTSIAEGTANFLVNRRMNKSQQMRWFRRGADLLLQVRCAVYNGTLGSELGHRFHPHANQNERLANTA